MSTIFDAKGTDAKGTDAKGTDAKGTDASSMSKKNMNYNIITREVMAQIYDTTDFPINNVRLGTPFNKSGVYFIKMSVDNYSNSTEKVSNAPIYIQPPKCSIKQGFIKSGKKIFCDLIFSIEDNSFLSWLEQMEEVAKIQIYENRSKWFETELDEHDIENSLASPYKMYKSGKWYIIRANIPNTLGKSDLKIYDESEREIFHEDLKEDTNVITILEFKGIKCSVRSFQFDIDVRQMLVVSPVKMFEKCIIRTSGSNSSNTFIPSNTLQENATRSVLEETFQTEGRGKTAISGKDEVEEIHRNSGQHSLPEFVKEDDSNLHSKSDVFTNGTSESVKYSACVAEDEVEGIRENLVAHSGRKECRNACASESAGELSSINALNISEKSSAPEPDMPFQGDMPSGLQGFTESSEHSKSVISDGDEVSYENHTKIIQENRVDGLCARENEICEIELDLDTIENSESVHLKKRNDVYYKMYKEAKRKAKEAKMIALSNYLEAKRIKHTYSFDASSEEESDSDDLVDKIGY